MHSFNIFEYFLHGAILILATARVSNLLVDEYGLFGIFAQLRNFFEVDFSYPTGIVDPYFAQHDKPEGQPNQIAGILSCFYCASLWLGIALALAYAIIPLYTIYICLPFALSMGAIILYKMT